MWYAIVKSTEAEDPQHTRPVSDSVNLSTVGGNGSTLT